MIAVSDVVTNVRDMVNDPNSSGRFSNGMLIRRTNLVHKALVREIKFPESRMQCTTGLNVQEYQVPEMIYPFRVYLAGVLLPHQNLDTLEGHQIQLYDSSGMGTANVPPLGGGPPGNLGQYVPQWTVAPPLSSPNAQGYWSYPAPAASPYFPGQRSIWYDRGGYIGIVPAPSASVTLTIDCLRVPCDVTQLTDPLVFPSNCLETITWRVIRDLTFSDDTARAMQRMQVAHQMYDREMRLLRQWISTVTAGDDPEVPEVTVGRAFFYGLPAAYDN
jgi:hypothetical protein